MGDGSSSFFNSFLTLLISSLTTNLEWTFSRFKYFSLYDFEEKRGHSGNREDSFWTANTKFIPIFEERNISNQFLCSEIDIYLDRVLSHSIFLSLFPFFIRDISSLETLVTALDRSKSVRYHCSKVITIRNLFGILPRLCFII